MRISSYRVLGDKRIILNGDDGKTYYFRTDETAMDWMGTNSTNIPTLASIAPTTAVIGGSDVTVTLTGTNFRDPQSEVWVDGVGPMARTFVSTTSMTMVLKPSTVGAAKTIMIGVKDNVYTTAVKPFTYTAAAAADAAKAPAASVLRRKRAA